MTKKTSGKKSGIELPEGMHGIMASIAKMTGRLAKDCYAEACGEWIGKKALERPSIRALLQEQAEESPEIASALRALKLPAPRPAKVANK